MSQTHLSHSATWRFAAPFTNSTRWQYVGTEATYEPLICRHWFDQLQ